MILVRALASVVMLLGPCLLAARADEDAVHEVPEEGLVVEGKFHAGGVLEQAYLVRLKKNQSYLFDLTSKEFDAYLTVKDPNGRIVASDDDSGGGLNSRLVLVPSKGETYQVLAKSFDKKLGAFQLKIREGTDWGLVAESAEAKEDYVAAIMARKNALELQTREFGAAHWKVIDAKLAFQHAEKLANLNAASRQELKDAQAWQVKGDMAHQADQASKCLEAWRKVLAIHTKVLGEDHRETASSLNTVGILLTRAGSYSLAKPYFEKALAIRKRVLGEDHPSTATP